MHRQAEAFAADFREALAAVREILDITRASLERLSTFEWESHLPIVHVICRAAACRQYEALRAALCLVDNNHGECAVPLLRPAIEEGLWLRYLESIPREDAESLLTCIMHSE
jgi:hypothetical protein